MQDEFSRLSRTVLDTFGKPIVILKEDGSLIDSVAIIKKELVTTGQFEHLIEETLVATLDDSIHLSRGDILERDGHQWAIDRRLSVSGHLSKWNIYEN